MNAANTSPPHLRFANQADAYLEWAVKTKWTGFVREGDCVALLIERKLSISLNAWKKWLTKPKTCIHIAACYQNYKFMVLWIQVATLEKPAWQKFSKKVFLRMELVSALTPPSANALFKPKQATSQKSVIPATSCSSWQPKAQTIMACIDDAFPIANTRFFNSNGSRVLRLWDQDQTSPLWHDLDDCLSIDFGYGKELINQAHPTQATHIQPTTCLQKCMHALVGLLGRATPPTSPKPLKAHLPSACDAENDLAYYQRLGLRELRRHHTHGSHVLDTFAGPIPVLNRISASRHGSPGSDAAARIAPTWKKEPVGDPNHADLVLVQLPQSAINDASGRWLGHHVLDGLHYILQASGEAKKIVTNISWGPQTGPHDGTSLFELAMDELLANHPQLSINLPAGNSLQARSHAAWCLNSKSDERELTWCIPPGIKHFSFLEIWSDQTDPFEVTLTSPTGSNLSLSKTGIVRGHRCGLVQVQHDNRRIMTLVVVYPTESTTANLKAPHGRWQLKVTPPTNTKTQFHAYVARTSSNMGSAYRQPDSYLLDETYETMARLPPHQQANLLVGNTVTQEGTLNGIATGQSAQLHVLAGYRLSDGQPAPYSSAGPVVGMGASRPNFAFPTDESRGLPGLNAGATRSGTVVRLVGTSTASPQMARKIVQSKEKKRFHDVRIGWGEKT